MEIIVCLKQVPDTETQIKIAGDGKSIVTDGIKWIINPYDEFGVEEALRVKEKFGGTVTIVCIGPKRATESIRTALAMGADKAVHLNDETLFDAEPQITAKALYGVIKDMPFDIIFCGKQAIDDDSAQVGAALAELLDIPHVSVITKLEIDKEGKKAKANQQIEGAEMIVEATLPALFTCQKGLNEPRYASLPGIMKAKKKELKPLTAKDLSVPEEELSLKMTEIVKMELPPKRSAAKIVEGEDPAEKAKKLVKLLREEAKVI